MKPFNVCELYEAFEDFRCAKDRLAIAADEMAACMSEMVRVLDANEMRSESGEPVCLINGFCVFRNGNNVWFQELRVIHGTPSNN